MAVKGNTYTTLADVAKTRDKAGNSVDVIEMLCQTNPILDHALALPCNSGTRHLTSIRNGLPETTFRRLYKGVNPGKSTYSQVYDACGMLENWAEIDAKLVDIDDDPASVRMNEAEGHLESISQKHATTIFYGNQATDADEFTGLAPRFNSLSAENGGQIVSGGGSGSDNTSIWFITWAPSTCHLIYPKNSVAGLAREDKGKETKEVSDGTLYDVYREKFMLDCGLSVRDWRYVSRLANIDVSDLTKDASSGADLNDLMIDCYYKSMHRKKPMGRQAIYCNTRVKSFLHKQALNANGNMHLSLREVDGEERVSLLGIPIYECDAIVNTEAAVS